MVEFVPKPETAPPLQTTPIVEAPKVDSAVTVTKVEAALNELHATVLKATAYLKTLIG